MLVEKVIKVLTDQDLDLLSEASPLANEQKFCEHEVVENGDSINSFHPTGKCGCMSLHDEYFADLRCGHLIWIDGYVEWNMASATLLVANHKGRLLTRVIIWKSY